MGSLRSLKTKNKTDRPPCDLIQTKAIYKDIHWCDDFVMPKYHRDNSPELEDGTIIEIDLKRHNLLPRSVEVEVVSRFGFRQRYLLDNGNGAFFNDKEKTKGRINYKSGEIRLNFVDANSLTGEDIIRVKYIAK
jgi:hypothetical protein